MIGRSIPFTHTVPADIRDYPEWHKGRTVYEVWIIPIGTAELTDYLEDVRGRLSDLLHPAGRRQPHLTLFVCGFEQARETWDDDFTPRQLQAQIRLLEASKGPACELPLLPPDSFATAAHLPVADPHARLRGWRETLASVRPEVRQSPYRPHVTIGLYRERVAAGHVFDRLAGLPPPPPLLPVRELCHATYEGHDLFGPLVTRSRIALEDRPWTVRTGAAR